MTPEGLIEPHLDENERESMATALLGVLDRPRKRSDSAEKTVLIDEFGTANSGKTTNTGNVERFFRRAGYQVFCPPETAEIEQIRTKSAPDATVFQVQHLTAVSDSVVSLSHNRNFHMSIISRGLIDMLYWFRMGRANGTYSEKLADSVRDWVFEQLRLDLVDAFFYFSCSPDVAMEREYANSPTKKQGSNMNLAKLTQAHNLYREVLDDVEANVPGLPIFHIDTTKLDEKATAEEVLRVLLPHLCTRFRVSPAYLSGTPSLLRKRTERCTQFEEQLKLRGQRVTGDQLVALGWKREDEAVVEDTYLNTGPPDANHDGVFEEIIRVRRTGESGFQLIYKARAVNTVLSHRRLSMFDITPEEAQEICRTHPTLAVIRKRRERLRLYGTDGHFFSMHLDTIDGLGAFTEIRALGSDKSTHTKALLEIAEALGFSMTDIIEGSYLGLALRR